MRGLESVPAGWMPMKKYKIAVLDDYQNVAVESADWSVLRDRADITVFQDHLADPDVVVEKLRPFDIVCRLKSDEVSIAVKDEGRGFDIKKVADPTAPENTGSVHGRGIYMMKVL